jgi:hypothetical protein
MANVFMPVMVVLDCGLKRRSLARFVDKQEKHRGSRQRGECMRRVANRRGKSSYSATASPEPPNSAGKSLSFGSPSRIGSTVSA